MTNLYTNRFCDQLCIIGNDGHQGADAVVDEGPFRVLNKTQGSLSDVTYANREEAHQALIEMGCEELKLPEDGTFAYNQQAQAMCIDGTNDEDQMESGALNAPFYVFNISTQENMTGPFSTHAEAVKSLADLAAK